MAGVLRVSKYLFDSLIPHAVVSFRPGHLSLPYALPEMLLATHYKYSYSITANSALTHLPYRANYSRSYDTELNIFEFPITIEDERGWLGDWWTVRDSALVQVDTVNSHIKRVRISTDGGIDGLAIRVPENWDYQEGLDGSQQQDDVLVLGTFEGSAQLLFSVTTPP